MDFEHPTKLGNKITEIRAKLGNKTPSNWVTKSRKLRQIW